VQTFYKSKGQIAFRILFGLASPVADRTPLRLGKGTSIQHRVEACLVNQMGAGKSVEGHLVIVKVTGGVEQLAVANGALVIDPDRFAIDGDDLDLSRHASAIKNRGRNGFNFLELETVSLHLNYRVISKFSY
jgi:hypothetical protein